MRGDRELEPDWFREVIKRKALEPSWFIELLWEKPTVELTKPKLPGISQPKDSLTSFEREKAAFLRMEKDLLKDHKGKFVAVFKGKVVGSDESIQKLAKKVYKKYGYIPVYVQKVGERRSIRMPSPRIKRK